MSGLKMLLLSAGIVAIPYVAAAEVEITCWAPASVGLAADMRQYWTPERIARAIPDGEILDRDNQNVEQKLKQQKNDTHERAPIGEAPYKFGGKLFYTRGGIDYEASAQFVTDDNIVIGAAHSLWKGGNQAINIIFKQGYSNGGGQPYVIDRAAVLLHWTKIADNDPSLGRSQFDYAVMRTQEASKVGKYELAVAGTKVGEDVTVTGYPATQEGGEYMYREVVRVMVQAGNAYDARPFLMSGYGASGGAWFVKQDQAFNAVSVVSGGNTDRVYGPAFTDDTVEMVKKVKTGC